VGYAFWYTYKTNALYSQRDQIPWHLHLRTLQLNCICRDTLKMVLMILIRNDKKIAFFKEKVDFSLFLRLNLARFSAEKITY
jgi:hypothetical protein